MSMDQKPFLSWLHYESGSGYLGILYNSSKQSCYPMSGTGWEADKLFIYLLVIMLLIVQ